MDISDFPSRHNHGLAIPQVETERLLATWVEELGVPAMREREVTGFTQDGTGVDVALSDGTSIRADYLVGCDGGRSVVRKAAGIEFAGWEPSTSWLNAEVEMAEKPEFGLRPGGGIGPAEGGDRIRVVLTEREVEHSGEPTLEDVREALIATDGTDYGVHTLIWSSRFTDNTRQAVAYRRGCVLLAGDAAHVHPPLGGQGLNTGVQDAVNLGWKLAQVVKRTSPESLLDTYHDERHPVGARVLRTTMAQVALTTPGERHQALRDILADLLSMDEPHKHLAGLMSGLDIHYDLGEGHPLLGRRMPDLDLQTAGGPTRVFALLHDARPVVLNLGEPGGLDIADWADEVRLVEGTHDGVWELPVMARSRHLRPCWSGRTAMSPGRGTSRTRSCLERSRPGSEPPRRRSEPAVLPGLAGAGETLQERGAIRRTEPGARVPAGSGRVRAVGPRHDVVEPAAGAEYRCG